MRVVCLRYEESGRSGHIAEAMGAGFKRHGCQVIQDVATSKQIRGDLAVAYGWRCEEAFKMYRDAGLHFLYVDLGFWNRKPPNSPREGHHKVVLDAWCPTKTMTRGCPGDRFARLGVEVRPPKPGQSIIVTGMSAKSAADHGYLPNQWEAGMIASLAAMTSRPIVYRPKPSWRGATPIHGAAYDEGKVPLAQVLETAHLILSHHSNTAVDAVVAGVSTYSVAGVGSLMSTPALDKETIEAPYRWSDAERHAFLADVAYLQWMPAEMRSGACWDHMRGQLQ